MIQRMLMRFRASLSRVDCRPAWSDSAWEQRENTRPGYVTVSVTWVAAATGSSPKVHQPSAHQPLARRETRLALLDGTEGRQMLDNIAVNGQ
jgi:hypothetical protein